jgi:hypothetical protein
MSRKALAGVHERTTTLAEDNLPWGDLVVESSDERRINGTQGLVPLDFEITGNDCGGLPREFEIWTSPDPETGLLHPPSNYWFDAQRGIVDESVWFDYRPFIDQLERNVTVDGRLVRDPDTGHAYRASDLIHPPILYTWFEWDPEGETEMDAKKHFIICYPHDRWYNRGWSVEPERERERFVRLYATDFRRELRDALSSSTIRDYQYRTLRRNGIAPLYCTPSDCNAGYIGMAYDQGSYLLGDERDLVAPNVIWMPSWYLPSQ